MLWCYVSLRLGLFLEFVAVALVARGNWRRARAAGVTPTWEKVKRSLVSFMSRLRARFGRPRSHHVELTDIVMGSDSAGSARATIHYPVEGATLDQNVEALKKNVAELRREVNDLHGRIDRERDDRTIADKSERQELEDFKRDLLAKERNTVSSEVSYGARALLILALGISFTTIASFGPC